MGTDISEGAKIGIILIILCSLIAIVFSLLTMMKNITSSGSQSLQNGLDNLTDSEFQSYDQKNVTGTDVKAAIKIFEGREIGFVVYTLGSQKGGAKAQMYGAILNSDQSEGTTGGSNAGKTLDCTVKVDPSADEAFTDSMAITKFKNNTYYTSALKNDATTGGVAYNTNIRPMEAVGTEAYVRDTGRFRAELIKDTSGTKIGVVFTQTK